MILSGASLVGLRASEMPQGAVFTYSGVADDASFDAGDISESRQALTQATKMKSSSKQRCG